MQLCIRAVLNLIGATSLAIAQPSVFPPRAANAPSGSEFAKQIESLEFYAREEAIYRQITEGNVPDFLRRFVPINITDISSGGTNVATIRVTPDYLAVGSDEDYLLIPMSPDTAQRLADQLGCALPTPKIVDEIWRAATVKLTPVPMTPGTDMVTVRKFAEHNAIVRTQRLGQVTSHPFGALVAGNKKDVVVSVRLQSATNRVAIYGWHRTNGQPIQPTYMGHTAAWVDYSHGIRLVHTGMILNGRARKVGEVLADAATADLLSGEGRMNSVRYVTATNSVVPTQHLATVKDNGRQTMPVWADFRRANSFDEWTTTFNYAPEVRVTINAPAPSEFEKGKTVRLIFYALPNGNTIEQTIGKKIAPGEDWHFNIQHIGGQLRWLRQRLTNEVLVVAYLEAAMKSWPAWRQKHGDTRIPGLVENVKGIFTTNQTEVVLTGHSGGGSFTFGYLNTLAQIPSEVTRIAFLDSNYGYRTTNHFDKLADWLQASNRNILCVLAYQDYLGLLDGKSFVSEQGGTWGRSQQMLNDLTGRFHFKESRLEEGLNLFAALNGRVGFIMKENAERKIWHTVQVERNGFIHSQLIGSNFEGVSYQYLGERVYEGLIDYQSDANGE